MAENRFPLAERMIVDLLGPLMGARGKIRFYHRGPLETFMLHLWTHSVDSRQWIRRVRAALYLLENGFNMHPRQLAPMVYGAFSKLETIQMEVFGLHKDAWRSDRAQEPDRRFRPLLDLYACLYERTYPVVAAPLVAADALLRGSRDPSELIGDDGRVRPTVVEQLEDARGYKRGLLTEGLNRHLRNSIAHGRYEVLSRDIIRMHDRDPRTGEVTWGPKEFFHSALRDQVFQFMVTCEALMVTLVMFDVNNHEVILERQYAAPKERRMRLDLAKAVMTQYADGYGFRCDDVSEPDHKTMKIKLTIRGERGETPAEILVGGAGWFRRYVQDVRTEESPIREQAYGVLQHTLDVHETYEWVIMEVFRSDGTPVGKVVADRSTRQQIFEGKKSIQGMRTLLAEDILSDEKMPVVFRDIPQPM